MKFGIPSDSLNKIIELLASYAEIDEAIIFGSRAMGNFKPGSDVDISLKGSKVSPKIIFNVSAALNERLPLPYYFDIVNYKSIDDHKLKEHIDDFGKLLYKKERMKISDKEA